MCDSSTKQVWLLCARSIMRGQRVLALHAERDRTKFPRLYASLLGEWRLPRLRHADELCLDLSTAMRHPHQFMCVLFLLLCCACAAVSATDGNSPSFYGTMWFSSGTHDLLVFASRTTPIQQRLLCDYSFVWSTFSIEGSGRRIAARRVQHCIAYHYTEMVV